MPTQLDDIEEFGADAPRPLDADSVARGSFERLGQGQGTVAHRRGAAHQAESAPQPEPPNRRLIAIIAACALAVVVIASLVVVHVLNSPAPGSQAQQAAEPERTETQADGSVSYRGASYALVAGANGYELVETRDDGQPVSLGAIDGTPVSLVLFDGTLVVPQNLEGDVWNVMAYTIGSGWNPIMSQDGNVQGGVGVITAATLEDSVLRLTVDASVVDVPLTW